MRADIDYVRLLQLVNGDDYLKNLFLGRTEALIPLLNRHYFQSVLRAMVYTRGGKLQNAAMLSDDGSTLNFVTKDFAKQAGLQQVGVWRGTIKQLKDTVELEAPKPMYQIFFQLAPPSMNPCHRNYSHRSPCPSGTSGDGHPM